MPYPSILLSELILVLKPLGCFSLLVFPFSQHGCSSFSQEPKEAFSSCLHSALLYYKITYYSKHSWLPQDERSSGWLERPLGKMTGKLGGDMAQTGLKTQHTDSSPPPQAPLKCHNPPCIKCMIPLLPQLNFFMHWERCLVQVIPKAQHSFSSLSIRKFAHGIIMNVESKEAALGGCLLPNCAAGFSLLLAEQMLTNPRGKSPSVFLKIKG